MFPDIVLTKPPRHTADGDLFAEGYASLLGFTVQWSARRSPNEDSWEIDAQNIPSSHEEDRCARELIVESHPQQFYRLVAKLLRWDDGPGREPSF